MNLKELKEIIDIVTSRESIEELELEKSGVRLRIRRAAAIGAPVPVAPPAAASDVVPSLAGPRSQRPAAPGSPESPEAPETDEELYYIKSPIVGTFYKAPSPSSDSFASVGDF